MSHIQLLLLQRPSLWTAQHLDAARVKIIEDVPATGMVGGRTPTDGDEEFEHVWRVWNVASESFNTQDRFMYSAEYLRSRDPERHPGSFFSALNELVDFLCDETAAGREMAYLLGRCIDFEIPRLCWVGLSYQNFLVRHGRDRSIPLAMISIIRQPSNTTTKETIARYEVPQCLLQGVLAYTREPSLGMYTGFTITLDGMRLRVSRALLSPSYLRRLCGGDAVNDEDEDEADHGEECDDIEEQEDDDEEGEEDDEDEDEEEREEEKMLLYRSPAFEIRGPGSREMIRLLVGVFRFVGYGEQAGISGRNVY